MWIQERRKGGEGKEEEQEEEKKGGGRGEGGGKEASARDYERLFYEFTQFMLATNKCLLNTFLIKIMSVQ